MAESSNGVISTLATCAGGVGTETSTGAAPGQNKVRVVKGNSLPVLPSPPGCTGSWSSFAVGRALSVGLRATGRTLFGGGVPVGVAFETGATKVELELLAVRALASAGGDTASGVAVKSI